MAPVDIYSARRTCKLENVPISTVYLRVGRVNLKCVGASKSETFSSWKSSRDDTFLDLHMTYTYAVNIQYLRRLDTEVDSQSVGLGGSKIQQIPTGQKTGHRQNPVDPKATDKKKFQIFWGPKSPIASLYILAQLFAKKVLRLPKK